MQNQIQKILIIDDDSAVCAGLTLLLKRRNYAVHSVNLPNVALETIQNYQPNLILLDMNFTIDTSGKQGLRLLEKITSDHSNIPIILMTGWATVQLAVKGMKMGARDFLAKPWDNNHLISSIKTVLSLYGEAEKSAIDSTNELKEIIGSSPEIHSLLKIVKNVSKTHANVLITGESGTGKELIAEAIHQLSTRVDQPFIKVNLGGISTSLFESEMFGHKKGAFTDASTDREGRFAKANKGTIFLDEIGELPLMSQVKLLRVLQERTFEMLGSSETIHTDVRVISATNKNLSSMVGEGSFREDLLYRINLIILHVPALRDRRTDIPALIHYFIKNVCVLYHVDTPYLSEDTLSYLSQQDYPGNIRQLKNIVERTILLNLGKKELHWKDFKSSDEVHPANKLFNLPNVGALTLEGIEIQMIQKALKFHNHSISSTARSLGITRSSLYRRLEKYNIVYEPKI